MAGMNLNFRLLLKLCLGPQQVFDIIGRSDR